jgi:hypothetical protein
MSQTIGAAKSNKFLIGSAEVRIGPLARAGQLTSNDSVGLLQSTTVNFTNESVDLKGGLPKTLIDTTIVEQTASVSAQAYEVTTNNLRVMLNAGFSTSQVGRSTTPDYAFNISAGSTLSPGVAIVTAASGGTGTATLQYQLPSSWTLSNSSTSYSAATVTSTATSVGAGSIYAFDSTGTLVADFNAEGFIATVGGQETVYYPSTVTYNSVTVSSVTYLVITWNFPYTSGTPSGTNAVNSAINSTGIAGLTANTTVTAVGQLNASATPGTSDSSVDLYEGVIKAAATASSWNGTLTTSIPSELMGPGDILVTYPAGSPQSLSVLQVASVSAQPNAVGSVITFNASSTPLLFNSNPGDIIYRTDDIGLGYNTTTQYFTMDVLSTDHATGRPYGFRFWKAAVSSGLDFSFSTDNYGTTPLAFKILKPSLADLQSSLQGIAPIQSLRPYGMTF